MKQPEDTEPAPDPTADWADPVLQQTTAGGLQRRSTQPPLPFVADMAEFGARVHDQLAESRRWKAPLALLFLDAGRVQMLHERHAATFKAQVLQEAGQRLRARVRATDVVLRVGHDSFGVLLQDAGEATARLVELRLTQALHAPYRVGAMMLNLSLLSGFAVYPQDAVTGADLVRSAERARTNSLEG